MTDQVIEKPARGSEIHKPLLDRIAVIGLGYVGLPLAIQMARYFPTTGYDISAPRVTELQNKHDRTGEVDDTELLNTRLAVTATLDDIRGHDIYIVTVPTPVDEQNEPDLGPVLSACRTVGKVMGKGAIVCFESTVYPGVTEKFAGPALEQASGLKCGEDFFLGYSPERNVPGDREHTVDKIIKIVSGQTPAVRDRLVALYGQLNGGKIHAAPSIMVAEAAKVIENAQRDLNIAFMNEISTIFRKLGISTYDVLEAAGTKWNFLKFTPGFVGGHCIGVDPYYLIRCAKDVGADPRITTAAREISNAMPANVAADVHALLKQRVPGGKPGRVLVLGLTFKENVPDLRNSKSADLVRALEQYGHTVLVADAHADTAEAKQDYGIDLVDPATAGPYDAIIAAVSHRAYEALTPAQVASWLTPHGIIADFKGIWRGQKIPENLHYWQV